MRFRFRSLFIALMLIAHPAIGSSPTTQHSAADPWAPLVAKVAGISANRSMVLVLRPDSGSSVETPSSIAGIRDAVMQALQAANLNISTSEPAESLLRTSAIAGQPTIPQIIPALAAAKTDLILCGVVHRGGTTRTVNFNLMDAKGSRGQISVTLAGKPVTAGDDDLTRAIESITHEIDHALAECAQPIQSAGVKTLLLAVRPEAATDQATPGFEVELYDAAAHQLHRDHLDVQPLGNAAALGVLKPAVVEKLKDLPPDSAVMLLSYSKRPGGMLVKFSVVSPHAQLAVESVGLNNWDVAAMPQWPVINTRVLAYSEAQQNKKVGNGECWTLAAEALKDASAQQANGYTFGRKLVAGEPIYPGDIMQFTSAKFEGKSANGGSWWMQLGFPHHTAVVRRVLGPKKYEILEQNPGPVKAATIDFNTLKSGEWEAYRPQAR